jgi:hypothetical protein
MHDHQIMFLIKLWASGNKIQTITFNEAGDMTLTFWDQGGNFHDQTLTGSNKLKHNEV